VLLNRIGTSINAETRKIRSSTALTSASSGRVLPLVVSLGLIALTVAVFWPVKDHDFVVYDDPDYVYDNPNLRGGLSLAGIQWAFTTTRVGNWHPLTWVSHIVDYALFGLWPGGHHLTSLFLHVLNSLLLLRALTRMTSRLWPSAVVAALFAIHPLHVESVAWVSERKDVLSTFFWTLTLVAYARYAERPGLRGYLLILLPLALGLMAKPMLVTVPFVLLLLDYWPLGRFPFSPASSGKMSGPRPSKETISRLIAEKVPLFLLIIASSVLTFLLQQTGGMVGTLQAYPVGNRVANAAVSYIAYIGKTIWPHRLAVFYPFDANLPLWQVASATLLLVAVSLLALRFARRLPYVFVGWFWYVGTLVPVIGLVQVGGQAMADRYTYVPCIGLFIAAAYGASDLVTRWPQGRIAAAMGAGIVLSAFAVVARLQVYHWKDGPSLFRHAIAVTRNNFLAHNNLGVELLNRGMLEEARAHFSEAIRIGPDYKRAHFNLGSVSWRQGKKAEAVKHYQEALRIDPNFGQAHFSLGLLYLSMEDTVSALKEYEVLRTIDTEMAQVLFERISIRSLPR
jgi:hypothetical protein